MQKEDMYVGTRMELDKTKNTIQRRRGNQHDKKASGGDQD
jgi:hypothetical protein